MHTGTAPIPASAGNTQRVRLNRGGNRRLNAAIHRIAITQKRMHEPAREYLDARRAKGNSNTEAIRALKRHIARRVYGLLKNGPQPASKIDRAKPPPRPLEQPPPALSARVGAAAELLNPDTAHPSPADQIWLPLDNHGNQGGVRRELHRLLDAWPHVPTPTANNQPDSEPGGEPVASDSPPLLMAPAPAPMPPARTPATSRGPSSGRR